MAAITHNGGFCGALQRAPPPMPSGISRRLINNDMQGIGKIKVMLRITDDNPDAGIPHFMEVDKKKRQIILTDPIAQSSPTASHDRRPLIASPKMFVFDSLFTMDDQQYDVCASALSDIIPAVLKGSDGCLLCIGYPLSGQGKTMLGNVSSSNELGVIPSAISWLYKGINEQRQKSGSRFSVRVSALGVSAIKPDAVAKDLLAAHASASDDSPGVYLSDDFLGGATELRAPSAERAALFLDAALESNPAGVLEPAMIFTLHVYQYSLSHKGGMAGGRSHLHLIDLGGCVNRNGGLSLISIGNILLAILSGQRHPPNRDHPLTPLLKDCLSPMNCHVAIIAHVSHSLSHIDSLTTIQLASRIHRMRRRKHRFGLQTGKAVNATLGETMNGGADLSSSELSADTVIYLGPKDDVTDGEHPPVYLPDLREDSQGMMNKMLRKNWPAKPSKKVHKTGQEESTSACTNENYSLKLPHGNSHTVHDCNVPSKSQISSPVHSQKKVAPQKNVSNSFRRSSLNSKNSYISIYKEPCLRRQKTECSNIPIRKLMEEQWIDGPKISRTKVAEARYLLREVNQDKKCETWVDGPKLESSSPLTTKNLISTRLKPQSYGFMDSEKKSMIRQWVETQNIGSMSVSSSLTHIRNKVEHEQKDSSEFVNSDIPNDRLFKSQLDHTHNSTLAISNISNSFQNKEDVMDNKSVNSLKEIDKEALSDANKDIDEDPDSGPSEIPPALPLIVPLGPNVISQENFHRILARHISRESLFQKQLDNDTQEYSSSRNSQQSINMSDCGTQVTEKDIAITMAGEHPLAALSHYGNISEISNSYIDADCQNNQFDQLARLRDLFTSQLAMAEVTPVFSRGCDVESVYSEPAYLLKTFPLSVCSESPHRAGSPVNYNQGSYNCFDSLTDMKQITSLRNTDGASDPNIPNIENTFRMNRKNMNEVKDKIRLISSDSVKASLKDNTPKPNLQQLNDSFPMTFKTQLPLLPLNIGSEAYDSGHDSLTPRTSKHSGISRRAESGYHSVATARDSDESSLISGVSKSNHKRIFLPRKPKKLQEKGLCNWFMNPFTCTYPETEGEISDF